MSTAAVAGSSLLEGITGLRDAVQRRRWVDASLNVVSVGLDSAQAVWDPAGFVARQFLGWVMERVQPLRQMLDGFGGDAARVLGYARSWRRAAAGLKAANGEVAAARFEGWTGVAADRYRQRAVTYRQALAVGAVSAEVIASATEALAQVVGAARMMVRELVSAAVVEVGRVAVVSVASFGWLAPAATAQAAGVVASFAGRIARVADAVRRSVTSLGGLLGRLQSLVQEWRALVRRVKARIGPPRDVHRAAGPKTYRSIEPLAAGIKGRNASYLVTLDDGTRHLYKPKSGQQAWENFPAGALHLNQVAASRVAEALRFDIVPRVQLWNGPHGVGSLQPWIDDFAPGMRPDLYPRSQREMLAVLDYAYGNTDGITNYGTRRGGDLVGSDHDYTFPADSGKHVIRSDFVAEFLYQPLSSETVAKVRAVDLDALRHELSTIGLSKEAVDGAIERLGEMQKYRGIEGMAWRGGIAELGPDGGLHYVRQSKE